MPSSSPAPSTIDRSITAFNHHFGGQPDVVVRAPGRVNIIGEHTDYNDGFVLPMALPFATVIAARAIDGTEVHLHSEGFPPLSFQLGDEPANHDGWGRYVVGAAALLQADFPTTPLRAWEATIESDIPTGAGLSSSAALEVAVLLTFAHMAGIDLDPLRAAQLGQKIENDVLGLSSGIMDQLISATARAGHASLIDCESLTSTPEPVPEVIVVIDTMSRRELVDSEYDDRRQACERVAAAAGAGSLRHVTAADLAALPASTDRNRASHVISENERTLAAAEAMQAGDAARLGELMSASHRSLRDLFEVSAPALDRAVEIAAAHPACFGARMTGGGFAGCCVAVVEATAIDHFIAAVTDGFLASENVKPELWACEPADGAKVILFAALDESALASTGRCP